MNNSYAIDTGSLYIEDEMVEETNTEISIDSLLSNGYFIGGFSAVTLLLSIIIGLLLAQSKIKKGFDIYED